MSIIVHSCVSLCTTVITGRLRFSRLSVKVVHIPSLYTAKSKKVALVTGHSGKWNNAMIYLSEHQTIASQFSMPKATFIESATMRDTSVKCPFFFIVDRPIPFPSVPLPPSPKINVVAELSRAKRASGAPWVRKFGKLSIRENLVVT